MIDTVRLPSKRVAAFGVTVVILLVGVFLVVRAASRPAYEATAEMTLGIPNEWVGGGIRTGEMVRPRPAEVASLNHEVHEVLESPLVAERAATLLTEADSSFDVDAALIEKNLRAEGRSDSAGHASVTVKYRADDPDEAREGANAIGEAYRQVTAFASPGDLEPDWQITSLSLASTPIRSDTLNSDDVVRFLLASMLAVYLTWRWWPDLQRQAARSDRLLGLAGVVSLLVGVFTGYIWLLALAFALGVWSVSGLVARYLDDKLSTGRETE
jgi:hypothetical protein